MTTVLNPTQANRIHLDIIMPSLLAAVADPAYALADPQAAARTADPKLSRFTMSSFPQYRIHYPLIITETVGARGSRLDVSGLYQYTHNIRLMVRSNNLTECRIIASGLHDWIQRSHIALCVAGYHDPRIAGQAEISIGEDHSIYVITITLEGTVYTRS